MMWPEAENETTCGPGSTIAATQDVRAWLPGALARLGVKRLLDAPCGDRNWMRLVETARGDGADVRLLDIRSDALPEADAILARDFFQHLSMADEARALENMRATGARWIITTCHGKADGDCETGGFRFTDRRSAWGEPADFSPDGKGGRILGVWPL